MSLEFLRYLTLISARTIVILAVLVIGLRLLGKRQLGQMNIYDVALLMAISNAVQNAMTGGRGHISVGIVCSGTLLTTGWLISRYFLRTPNREKLLIGSPSLMASNGKLIESHLRREHVTREEIMQALRQYGHDSLDDVSMVVLEVDGSFSVVPKDDDSEEDDDNDDTGDDQSDDAKPVVNNEEMPGNDPPAAHS